MACRDEATLVAVASQLLKLGDAILHASVPAHRFHSKQVNALYWETEFDCLAWWRPFFTCLAMFTFPLPNHFAHPIVSF